MPSVSLRPSKITHAYPSFAFCFLLTAPNLRSESESDYSASDSDEQIEEKPATAKTPSKGSQTPSKGSQTPGKTPSKKGKNKVRFIFEL